MAASATTVFKDKETPEIPIEFLGFYKAAKVYIEQINKAFAETELRITDPHLTEALTQLNILRQGVEYKQALECLDILNPVKFPIDTTRKENIKNASTTLIYIQTLTRLRTLADVIKHRLFLIEAFQVAAHWNMLSSFAKFSSANLIQSMNEIFEAFENKLKSALSNSAKLAADSTIMNSFKKEFDTLKESELKAAKEKSAYLHESLKVASAAKTITRQHLTQVSSALLSIKNLPAICNTLRTELEISVDALPSKLTDIETRINNVLESFKRAEELHRVQVEEATTRAKEQATQQAEAERAKQDAKEAAATAQTLARQLSEAQEKVKAAQIKEQSLINSLNDTRSQLREADNELAEVVERLEAAEKALAASEARANDYWVIEHDHYEHHESKNKHVSNVNAENNNDEEPEPGSVEAQKFESESSIVSEHEGSNNIFASAGAGAEFRTLITRNGEWIIETDISPKSNISPASNNQALTFSFSTEDTPLTPVSAGAGASVVVTTTDKP